MPTPSIGMPINKKMAAVIFVLVAVTFFFVFKTKPISPSETRAVLKNNNLSVTAADLISAGFLSAQPQPPEKGKFLPPNLYFQVKEKQNPLDRSGQDLVMVLIKDSSPINNLPTVYGADSKYFYIPGGNGQESIMPDSRLAINFAKGNFYVVLTGSSAPELEKLAIIISQKI